MSWVLRTLCTQLTEAVEAAETVSPSDFFSQKAKGDRMVAVGEAGSAGNWVVRKIPWKQPEWPWIVELREAAEENLGWYSLQDRPPEQREQMLALLCTSLLPAAERELPADLPNREGVVAHLRALVDLCCG